MLLRKARLLHWYIHHRYSYLRESTLTSVTMLGHSAKAPRYSSSLRLFHAHALAYQSTRQGLEIEDYLNRMAATPSFLQVSLKHGVAKGEVYPLTDILPNTLCTQDRLAKSPYFPRIQAFICEYEDNLEEYRGKVFLVEQGFDFAGQVAILFAKVRLLPEESDSKSAPAELVSCISMIYPIS